MALILIEKHLAITMTYVTRFYWQ